VVDNFCVPIKRAKPLRNRIYAEYNSGFNALPSGLISNCDINSPDIKDQSRTKMDDGKIMLSANFAGREFRAIFEGDKIYFSQPLNGGVFKREMNENWLETIEKASSGSFIVDPLHGHLLDIGVSNGRLLVVQQFALSTLSAPYEESGFNLELLTVSYKQILPGTARTLGDNIFFFTYGGMCQFNGRQVTLLDIDYKYISGTEYFAFILENRYYLSILGSNCKTLVLERFFDSYFFVDSKSEKPNLCVWESTDFALGYASTRQFIKQLRVRTTGKIIVMVKTEKREQRIVLNGRETIQAVNINLKGGAFRVRFETNEDNVQITDLAVVIGFVSDSIGTIRIG